MQSRKQFLKHTGSMAAGLALFGTDGIYGTGDSVFKHSSISFDLHCHPGRLFEKGSSGFGEQFQPGKTLADMNAVHLSGAFFALLGDAKLIKLGDKGVTVNGRYKPGEGWAEYKRQLKDMNDFFRNAPLRPAIKFRDLKGSGPVAAFLSVEGGDFLDGQAERLDEAYSDGIRSVQLVHYAPNDLGDLQTSAPEHGGLSSFGKEVVRKMNKLGMLIDVAHASFETVRDVSALTGSPIMLSHSILEMEADRPIGKRAISAEHAKLVSQTGGLIGAWPSGFNKSFDEYIDNIRRLVDTVGIDHVGIGTDMDGNFKPVLASYSQFPLLAPALKNKGFTPEEVGKIIGGNAVAVLKKVLK